MNQPDTTPSLEGITAESLATLRQTLAIADILLARAAKCDHLEKRNKALQAENDSLRMRCGVLHDGIRTARGTLSGVMPELDGQGIREIAVEAAARIRNLREASAAPTPHPGDTITIALRLARQPENDILRVAIASYMVPHLRPGENVDTGALRILADRVEWLEKEAEECRVMLHDVASGRVDSRVRQERDTQAARGDELFAENQRLDGDIIRMIGELAVSRAENGRQAATIAALQDACSHGLRAICLTRDYVGEGLLPAIDGWEWMDAGRKLAALVPGDEWAGEFHARVAKGKEALKTRYDDVPPVRIETPHTGRDDKALFRVWMGSSAQPFVSLAEYAAALKPEPLHLEVGKTYVRRDGGRETIVRDRGEIFEYRFETASDTTYHADGSFGGYPDHKRDLVALAPAVDPHL